MKLEGAVWGGYCWDRFLEERIKDSRSLENFGYKVYSQNDEDGIIKEIFCRIGTTNKEFIEFGVQDGLECNSHYLLHLGWKGLWIEGSKKYCHVMNIKFKPVISNGRLRICNAFITRDNINQLIEENSFKSKEPDFLSIDIDGNDWYVWEAINCIKPRVVCIEYNGKFPPDYYWKQAYNANHSWDGSDWQGASLKAMELLGEKKGYQLVGTNINGVNAFFVRKELINNTFLTLKTAEELYNPNRKKLKFYAAGHKAKYGLIDQEENKGFLNYYNSMKELKQEKWKEKIERIKLSNFKQRIVSLMRGGE